MDIPDEAWIAAHSVADADLDEVVRAVTPRIAGAAQVAILREMAARFRKAVEDSKYQLYPLEGRTDREVIPTAMHGYDCAWRDLEAEADALEAGAGQAATEREN